MGRVWEKWCIPNKERFLILSRLIHKIINGLHSFTWSNGFTSSEQNITVTETGLYTLRAVNECNDITQEVEVNAQDPVPDMIEVGYNGPICEFELLQVFAEDLPNLIYNWSGPLGWTSNEAKPIVNLGANSLRSGDYILRTETSRLGCQITVTEEMEGVELQMPSATRNFYVDGHVPKPH